MSGGKGGSTSSTVEVPQYIEDAARRNLARADTISQIGFTPYYGPDVAAFTPMQEAAFQGTAQTAGAFGLPGGDMSMQDISGGMPAPTTYAGGVRGYSSAPMYEESMAEFAARRPGQKALIDSLFIDPYSGVAGSNVGPLVDYTATPGDLGGISAGGGDDTPYAPPVVSPVTPPVTPPVIPGPIYGGVPVSPTEGAVFTSTDFSGEETPYTIVTPTDVRPPGYVDSTPETFPELREYYDSSPLNPPASAVLKFDDGTSVDLGYDLGPSVAGGRGTIVPGQTTDIGLVSGGGADGVGNFGQVGDILGGIGDTLGITDYSGQGGGLLSGLNVTGPYTGIGTADIATTPTQTPSGTTYANTYTGGVGSKPAHATDNDKPAGPGDTGYDQARALEALQSGGTGIIYKDDRREVYVDGVMVGNPKRADEAREMLDRELKKKAEAAPASSAPASGVSGSTAMEVRSLPNGTEYFVDSSGNFAGLK